MPSAPHLRLVQEDVSPASSGLDALSRSPVDPRDRAGVFKRFAPYVGRIAFRLLGRQDEVDDVVQDVFLSAQRGLDALRDEGAVKAWLATVTVRKSQRRLKRRRLRISLGLEEEADYSNVATGGAGPADRTLLREVYAALDRVPTAERIAWTLRHVEGEKLQNVATLCDCSLATAKRRIAMAHARILEEVGDD